MRKYRLIERKNIFDKNKRFYPQVRIRTFLGIGIWKKIVKHSNMFSLFPNDDYKYPKTKEEAEELCSLFEKWVKAEKNTVNMVHKVKVRDL